MQEKMTKKLKKVRMSNNISNEKLDKIAKKLDLIIVILLAKSGLTRKEIAETLDVSEKTIQRLIPVSKIKATKAKKNESEGATESAEN